MEKNASFPKESVTELYCRLTWAQLELLADDVQEIQVLVSGDDQSVTDLRIEERDGRLIVEQPPFVFSLNFITHKWTQVCIRIPKDWRGIVDAHTVSGLLNSRGIKGTEVTLDTVSGDMRAMAVSSEGLTLRTVSGDIKGGDLRGERMSLRTVSGDARLQSIAFEQARLNTVSGDVWLEFRAPFARVDGSTVSGDLELLVPMTSLEATLKAVSGRINTSGVVLKEGGSSVHCSAVSGDLTIISTLEKTQKA
jgi:hypothetical protein